MDNDRDQQEPVASPNEGVKTQGLYRNTLSLVGGALAAVSLANIIFLFLIDAISGHPSPYVGIFGFMVMPAFLVLGLLLIPVGMLLERNRRRRRAAGEIPPYPRIDLNNPKQRSALAFFLSFVVVFVILSAVGSYRAYEFSDSVQFCGQLCHTVMNPEFQAYSLSPHARVRCVDCHVGTGASWYVRSKLSGARQVYAVMFNKFPRPIPTPVENLRPAQETCEACHWPQRFVGDQFRILNHFAEDEKNTPRQTRLLIRTGGGDPTTGKATGIHWHMNIGFEINYAVTDPKRQKIDWVEIKDRQTGQTEVYKAKDTQFTDAQFAAAPKRTMDCIDCHNRPTHIYVPPDRSIDLALAGGRLDPTMPYIKREAVAALAAEYKTTPEAMQGIERSLREFYANYPAVQQVTLNNAIKEVQRIYSVSIFPEMKVDWRTHPDNVGHFYYPGCFRCHDGQHVNAKGKAISNDCYICHVFQKQETGTATAHLPGVNFDHAGGEIPEGMKCMDCHSGGVGP
ncbi:MAG: cytochrome c3 family protein [Terriglobales bacterium]